MDSDVSFSSRCGDCDLCLFATDIIETDGVRRVEIYIIYCMCEAPIYASGNIYCMCEASIYAHLLETR